MSKLIDIPIAKIKPHPHNVRRDAVADDELINSVKEQGILQPIGVVQDGAKYLLIAGHRRLAAAKGAKLKEIPAIIHEHLVTEAQQIEAMLVENGRRVDLTAMEEAEGYQQLELLGVDVAAIASKTGRSTKTVKARLTLVKLPEPAREALHGHQITIGQAEQLVSLERHPDLATSALKSLGGNNFEYSLRSAVQNAEQRDQDDALREKYSSLGLPEIKKPKGGWNYETGPVTIPSWDEEKQKQADAWYAGDTSSNSYDRSPKLVITKIEAKPKSAAELKREKQREREVAKQRQEEKDRALASQLRFEHVSFLTAALPGSRSDVMKPLMPHLRTATARMVAGMTAGEIEAIVATAGTRSIELKRFKNDYHNDEIAAQILALTEPQLLAVFGMALASIATGHTYVGYGRMAGKQLENAGAYWAAFAESGYQLPDIDAKAAADITEKLAAAQNDEQAGAA